MDHAVSGSEGRMEYAHIRYGSIRLGSTYIRPGYVVVET